MNGKSKKFKRQNCMRKMCFLAHPQQSNGFYQATCHWWRSELQIMIEQKDKQRYALLMGQFRLQQPSAPANMIKGQRQLWIWSLTCCFWRCPIARCCRQINEGNGTISKPIDIRQQDFITYCNIHNILYCIFPFHSRTRTWYRNYSSSGHFEMLSTVTCIWYQQDGQTLLTNSSATSTRKMAPQTSCHWECIGWYTVFIQTEWFFFCIFKFKFGVYKSLKKAQFCL